MKTKFLRGVVLPDYLEEALAPFTWSGIFSEQFKDDVILVLMCNNQKEMTELFCESLSKIEFLSKEFKDKLVFALRRFANEDRKKVITTTN
jgi:hypothetical protein